MRPFPRTKAETIAAAQALIGGPTDNPTVFPAPPGLPADLQAALDSTRQGEGWVFLDWKAPTEGGAVASYKIERRERPAGDWTIAGVAIETESTLNNQERGKDWEYRVIAVNKAGDGPASNTAAAVV